MERPSYYGAPPAKEKRRGLFLNPHGPTPSQQQPMSQTITTQQREEQGSELVPLLEATLRNAKFTEDVANATLDVLERQGESIDSSINKVGETKTIMSQAKGFVHELRSKMSNRKICLWSMLILLTLANIALFLRLATNHGHLFG